MILVTGVWLCFRIAASSNKKIQLTAISVTFFATAKKRHTCQPLILAIHGGFAAVNRGADCVQLLVPALRARTRSWTGHRTPISTAIILIKKCVWMPTVSQK